MDAAEVSNSAVSSPSAAPASVGSRSGRAARFSLRTLLLLVTAAGTLLGAWRLLGIAWSFTIFFAIASLVPFSLLHSPWKRWYATAWAAIYGPFVFTSLYTLAFVPCSHCKAATWTTLPVGPGLIFIEFGRRQIHLPQLGESILFGLALLSCLIVLCGLTWFLYCRGWRLRIVALTLVIAYNIFAAGLLLAMIRM